MIEVEIKLKINDEICPRSRILEVLMQKGFSHLHTVREEDYYFDNAKGQIRHNGQALRVRKVTDLASGQEESVITFKGKKMDSISMSRKELETGVDNGQTAIELLEALGYYRVSPAVIKTRSEYHCDSLRMNACLDAVQGLGDFLELEIIEEEAGKDEALEKIVVLLHELGYQLADTTTTSYLSQLQGVQD